MSFINTMPEEDIQLLAERLQKYIKPEPTEKETTPQNKTYSVLDVAKITKQDKQTVRAHIKAELLSAKKMGKKYIITQENLTKYIENEK